MERILRVCYFGLYDPEYPRNAILRRGLKKAGVHVSECRVSQQLAAGHVRGTGGQGFGLGRLRYELSEVFRMFIRLLVVGSICIPRCLRTDVIILAEFNQGLALFAYAIAVLRGIPIVIDLLISEYDTAVNDRKLLKKSRPRALYRYAIDKLAINLGKVIIVDTKANAEYYEAEFGGLIGKAHVIQVGAPDWLFLPAPPTNNTERLLVLFYGNFIPLHGIDYIIQAAHLLRDDTRFHFLIVGTGQLYTSIHAEYERNASGNVEFLPPCSLNEIYELVKKADICLGVFGMTEKAGRVVPNKVWQCLSAGRPVITGNGPGPESVFVNEIHCLLIPRGDPDAIVIALDRLARDRTLAANLASNGARLITEKYGSEHLGKQFADILRQVAKI